MTAQSAAASSRSSCSRSRPRARTPSGDETGGKLRAREHLGDHAVAHEYADVLACRHCAAVQQARAHDRELALASHRGAVQAGGLDLRCWPCLTCDGTLPSIVAHHRQAPILHRSPERDEDCVARPVESADGGGGPPRERPISLVTEPTGAFRSQATFASVLGRLRVERAARPSRPSIIDHMSISVRLLGRWWGRDVRSSHSRGPHRSV